MRHFLRITFILFISIQAVGAQTKPAFSLCGKTGDCTMTWEEFTTCKKELTTTDPAVSIGSFIVTVKKANKKDFEFLEFPAKGNKFSAAALEMIEKLHKDKKLGDTIAIDTVEVVQSGKAAKKVPGMVITLN